MRQLERLLLLLLLLLALANILSSFQGRASNLDSSIGNNEILKHTSCSGRNGDIDAPQADPQVEQLLLILLLAGSRE
jgi:hypothetical protein